MMKIVLSIVSMLCFSALVATPAFAEDEWLLNGEKLNMEKKINYESELLIEDMNSPTTTFIVDCSELAFVDITPGGLTKTLEFLSLSETSGTDCVLLKGACTESTVKVEILGLPWEEQILLAGSKFLNSLLPGGSTGYLMECPSLLGNLVDSCTGEITMELVNIPEGGVEGILSENEEITKSLTCTLGGAKEGLLLGKARFTDPEGRSLSVS
jgi:hypothetical protein